MEHKDFSHLYINQKAEYLWANGEFVAEREYYNHRVCLYTLDGFLVEVHYSPEENTIDRIEVVTDTVTVDRYMDNIEITMHLSE